MGIVDATPRPFYPVKETRYPLYRRLGGPQGRSGRAREISPPPGFDQQTSQSVESCYTDSSILAQVFRAQICKSHIEVQYWTVVIK
jgi:hypothetical protein